VTDPFDDPAFGAFYDKDANRITMRQWASLKEDPAYSFLARSKAGHYLISTVWIGIDLSFGDDSPPLIFETMVFDANSSGDYMDSMYCRKYASTDQALLGHQEAVEQLKHQPPEEGP
jgi:hypothetical protein